MKDTKPEIEHILTLCKETVLSVVPDATIILYGSRARGDDRPDSDLDMLVLVDDDVDYPLVQKIRHRLYDIELENHIVISSIVRNENEWNSEKYEPLPLRKEIEKEGVEL